MRQLIVSSVLFLIAVINTQAQRTDKKLQTTIQSIVSGFQGDIGIYVKNLRTGKIAMINADTVFPTAPTA